MTEKQLFFKLGQMLVGNKSNYKVIDVPERGGIAQVYVLEDSSTGRKIILKLDPDSREVSLLRAVKLALIQQRLPATRVVKQVEDLLRDAPPGWSTHMEEFAPGRPCKNSRPSIRQALEIATQFAETLRACAANNIAYLDVKPLDHVFWEETSDGISTTVIDWNISVENASIEELRLDVIYFCRRLPEFFTGARQQVAEEALHPLSWSLESQSDIQGRKLPFVIWRMLAHLALTWHMPALAGLESVVRLPNGPEMSDRGVAREAVLLAWDSILTQLHQTQAVFNQKDPDFDTSNWDGMGLNELEHCLIWFSAHPEQLNPGQWESLCRKAHADVDSLVRRMRVFDTSSLRATGRWGQNFELNLPMMRCLEPRNQALALAWSIYEASRILYKNRGRAEGWEQFAAAFIEEKTDDIKKLLENRSRLDTHLQACLQGLPSDNKLVLEWNSGFTRVVNEAAVWVYLTMAKQEGNTEKAAGYLSSAEKIIPHHPLVKSAKRVASESRSRQQQVQDAERELHDSYLKGDIETLRLKIEEFAVLAESDTHLKNQIQSIRMQITRHDQIARAINSWDKQVVFDALNASGFTGVQMGESLPSEENLAQKLLEPELKRKLEKIQTFEDFSQNVQPLLDRVILNPTSLSDLVDNAINISQAADVLAQKVTAVADVPRFSEIQKRYNDFNIAAAEVVERWESSHPVGEVPTFALEKTAHEIRLFQDKLDKQTGSCSVSWINELKKLLESRSAHVSEELRRLESMFNQSLSDADATEESLADAYKKLPPGLQVNWRMKYEQAVRALHQSKIDERLQKKDFSNAEALIEKYRQDFTGDGYSAKKNELHQARLVEEARQLLQFEPMLWNQEARNLLENIKQEKNPLPDLLEIKVSTERILNQQADAVVVTELKQSLAGLLQIVSGLNDSAAKGAAVDNLQAQLVLLSSILQGTQEKPGLLAKVESLQAEIGELGTSVLGTQDKTGLQGKVDDLQAEVSRLGLSFLGTQDDEGLPGKVDNLQTGIVQLNKLVERIQEKVNGLAQAGIGPFEPGWSSLPVQCPQDVGNLQSQVNSLQTEINKISSSVQGTSEKVELLVSQLVGADSGPNDLPKKQGQLPSEQGQLSKTSPKGWQQVHLPHWVSTSMQIVGALATITALVLAVFWVIGVPRPGQPAATQLAAVQSTPTPGNSVNPADPTATQANPASVIPTATPTAPQPTATKAPNVSATPTTAPTPKLDVRKVIGSTAKVFQTSKADILLWTINIDAAAKDATGAPLQVKVNVTGPEQNGYLPIQLVVRVADSKYGKTQTGEEGIYASTNLRSDEQQGKAGTDLIGLAIGQVNFPRDMVNTKDTPNTIQVISTPDPQSKNTGLGYFRIQISGWIAKDALQAP